MKRLERGKLESKITRNFVRRSEVESSADESNKLLDEFDGLRDPVTSENYLKWRNLSLITIPITLGFLVKTLQADKPTKRKRINNKEKLRE